MSCGVFSPVCLERMLSKQHLGLGSLEKALFQGQVCGLCRDSCFLVPARRRWSFSCSARTRIREKTKRNMRLRSKQGGVEEVAGSHRKEGGSPAVGASPPR